MLYAPRLLNNLKTLCENYAAYKGHGLSTVQRRMMDDSKFFERKENGGSFTVAVYDRYVCRFAAAWPPERPWPKDIERPTANECAMLEATFAKREPVVTSAIRQAATKRAKRNRQSNRGSDHG